MEKFFTRPFSNWTIIGIFGTGIVLGQINLPEVVLDFFSYFFGAYFAFLYIYSNKVIPKLKKNEVQYSEWSASGYSHCHIFTKLGGGRNCIRLRLTRDLLIISSWFPFSLLAPVFDMVHVIPYTSIKEITSKKTFWMNGFAITYRDKYQESVTFTVLPKNVKIFTSVLKDNLAKINQAANLSLNSGG